MSKIALLTNFMEFNPGYSLTGICLDQARMLSAHGHDVHLFVNDQYHGEEFSKDVTLHKQIPFTHLTDYTSKKDLSQEHKDIVDKTAAILKKELADFDFAFTHDFVFTGWFLPYGLACQKAGKEMEHIRWLHWIHSVPTALKDWWYIREFGPRHKLIFPNSTDRTRVAEQYRGNIEDVRIIHHIKDLRTWFDFDHETCEFIDEFPGVMQADVVQVYPASTDRLEAKGVDKVMLIMSKIKKMGFSVCFVCANQWATGRQRKEDVSKYLKIASRNGLIPQKEFIFTSEWEKPLADRHPVKDTIANERNQRYPTGLPKRILRELLQCANLFVFPTREESFGLVLPEAALAGGMLVVLNQSLQMMLEVGGYSTIYFDFGSYHHTHTVANEGQYFNDIAQIILGRMKENEAIAMKTFCRQRYNWDHLYNKEYSPVLAEARTWV